MQEVLRKLYGNERKTVILGVAVNCADVITIY